MNSVIRIIKHAESYEVRISRFLYFDDNPGRDRSTTACRA